MNVCDRFLGLVSEYVEGFLTGSQKNAFEAHVENCPICRSKVREMRTLLHHLRSLPRVKASADFDTVLRARIGFEKRLKREGLGGWLGVWPAKVSFYGAAAALVVIATVLVRQELSNSGRTEPRSEVVRSSASVLDQPLQAPPVVFPLDPISPSPLKSVDQRQAVRPLNESTGDSVGVQQRRDAFEGKIQPVHVRM